MWWTKIRFVLVVLGIIAFLTIISVKCNEQFSCDPGPTNGEKIT